MFYHKVNESYLIFKKAGELLERIKDDHGALDSYKIGKIYRKGKQTY